LLAKRSARWEEQVYVVEGLELVRLAVLGSQPVESIYFDGQTRTVAVDALCNLARSRGVPVYELQAGVLAKISDTVTPQPVLAVVPMALHPLEAIATGFVVVLAELRDPGNVGTLIRTAEASGSSGVVIAGQAVDPFNPKTVRSSAGTVLWCPIAVEPEVARCVDQLRTLGYTVLGTEATYGTPYDQCRLNGRVAIVLGNEAHGLDDESASRLDGTISIPMAGSAESLNVGVAGAVICFEALRQRRMGTEAEVPVTTMRPRDGGGPSSE
jgi:TrmH family RNA methyltransferase